MAGVESSPGLRPWHWGLVVTAALGLKQAYALAGAAQLQWILLPLVRLLEAVSDLRFQPLAGGEWLDAGHQVLLVKACVGGNFLLASWLGYLWRWRHAGPAWRGVALALAAAWPTALAANALRILLLVHGQDDLARLTGLSAEDSHRLIGIGVYFSGLWLQLSAPSRAFPALVAAVALYLGINLLLPALRAWLLDLPRIDSPHALWVAAIPLFTLLLMGVWRGLRRPPARASRKERIADGAMSLPIV